MKHTLLAMVLVAFGAAGCLAQTDAPAEHDFAETQAQPAHDLSEQSSNEEALPPATHFSSEDEPIDSRRAGMPAQGRDRALPDRNDDSSGEGLPGAPQSSTDVASWVLDPEVEAPQRGGFGDGEGPDSRSGGDPLPWRTTPADGDQHSSDDGPELDWSSSQEQPTHGRMPVWDLTGEVPLDDREPDPQPWQPLEAFEPSRQSAE